MPHLFLSSNVVSQNMSSQPDALWILTSYDQPYYKHLYSIELSHSRSSVFGSYHGSFLSVFQESTLISIPYTLNKSYQKKSKKTIGKCTRKEPVPGIEPFHSSNLARSRRGSNSFQMPVGHSLGAVWIFLGKGNGGVEMVHFPGKTNVGVGNSPCYIIRILLENHLLFEGVNRRYIFKSWIFNGYASYMECINV